MNNINFSLLNTQKSITFCSNSKNFRKEYSAKIQNNNLSQTNISNINGITNRFANEGLTYNEILKAAKKNPFILFQKPETIEYNIREVAKRFKNSGLTTEKYLKCALNQCMLFSCSPDNIEKNINGTVKLFESYGLNTEKYINCAIFNPSIFTLKPESLKKKIFKIAESLDIPTADILEMFIKQPIQFSCNEKSIIKKYEIFKYIEENKIFDSNKNIESKQELNKLILRKKFTNSVQNSYMHLLRNKISNNLERGTKIPHFNIERNLRKFILDNKFSNIEFTILKGKYANDFIKFAKQFSKNIAGRNIFKIKIISK